MIKIRETDPMEYQEGMEKIDHSIMNKVLAMVDDYDYSIYTAADVRNVLAKESIDNCGCNCGSCSYSYCSDEPVYRQQRCKAGYKSL